MLISLLRRLLDALLGRSAARARRPAAPPASTNRGNPPPAPAPGRQPPGRRVESMPLDVPTLTPLAGSELKQMLARRGDSSWRIFSTSWWGRRGLIPPSTDERTQLIDRGMIGRGLVSAAEIAAIHEVGDTMLRLQPELDGSKAVGQAAVLADREARKQRREQKRAEAAEQKRLRAEAIVLRRATDIVFLGRGVSAGLADRTADAGRLAAAGLPVLATPAEVAAALQLPVPQLRWLAFHSEATGKPHYQRFTVPKKSGGSRELAAPMLKLRATQDWILQQILAKVQAHDAAHGFVPGRSTTTNALPHLHRHAVVNLDLRDFFPTIHVHRVRGLFEQLGYSPAAATILALLCTEAPRRLVEYCGRPLHVATGPRCLPQGAPTSPAISNLIARRLDARLRGLAEKLDFAYTRYADDMSFSARSAEAASLIGYLLARVRHIARAEGFAVNEKKTRVQRPSSSQQVTGIVVNGDVPRVDRRTVRRLRAILHQAERTGLDAQNRDGHTDFAAHVRGLIAYIHMVQPAQAAPLRDAWRRVRRAGG